MYAGNGSFNTHLFTGNSGGGNGTAAANYSGGYMGNVPSRPQSASSFLSLVSSWICATHMYMIFTLFFSFRKITLLLLLFLELEWVTEDKVVVVTTPIPLLSLLLYLRLPPSTRLTMVVI